MTDGIIPGMRRALRKWLRQGKRCARVVRTEVSFRGRGRSARDSNPQQPEPQSGALPLSYGHHTRHWPVLEISLIRFSGRLATGIIKACQPPQAEKDRTALVGSRGNRGGPPWLVVQGRPHFCGEIKVPPPEGGSRRIDRRAARKSPARRHGKSGFAIGKKAGDGS